VASLRHESGVFKQEKMSIVSVNLLFTSKDTHAYMCHGSDPNFMDPLIQHIVKFVALLVIMLKYSG